MKELIGKTIKEIRISEDKTMLAFRDSDDVDHYYYTVGDCCSRSWVEHIEGVDYLIGAEVLSSEDMDMPEPKEIEEYEVIKFYGVKLKTSKGIFQLEYRNSSNGYYGGYLLYNETGYCTPMTQEDKDSASIILTTDF